jgi:uncharacterized protein YndB with AHSA1/START domain
MSTDKLQQVYEIFIRTTPEQLWQAITDAAFTRRFFFGTSVSSTLQPGAPIVYAFPDGTTAVEGTILAADPPRKLVHTWQIRYDPTAAGETSRVTWLIDPRGPSCKLRAIHELDGAPHTASNVGNDGWTVILSSLKTLLETGESLEVAPAAPVS